MRERETVNRPRTTRDAICGAAMASAAVLVVSGAIPALLGAEGAAAGAAGPGASVGFLGAPDHGVGTDSTARLAPGTALEAQEMALLVAGDADRDGLPDAQEQILETLPHAPDSDGDG